MRVHAVTHFAQLRGLDLSPYRLVIMDVVRASTTIAHALAHGAAAIVPLGDPAAAIAMRDASPGRVLAGGERGGLPVPGFDLGNSPREYTEARVAGKRITFSTTNGTFAILACHGARETIIAALVNLDAVARRLLAGDPLPAGGPVLAGGDNVLLVPVGRLGAPVLDDSLAAGVLASRLAAAGAHLTDAAQSLLADAAPWHGRELDALRASPSGLALIAAGLGDDLPVCARVSTLQVVPLLRNGEIRPAS